ncbi:MFS transporter [Halomonas binhaiensis]|uniref:MFS transporter n=1 Tax=Halomonas binhaiensis TaxID=2562282 RepID=A0A5C1NK90_9GAMM|nr:MFS transporter [Halomonas binhaiensis]QEM83764.1 MFS transporter [Halomonas binhaiensis]
MNTQDPRDSLHSRPMSRYQIWIITLCTLIAALDGFDVLVMAFTAPAIAEDWSVSASSLGILFSAGLLGMGLGAFLVAPLGDRYGRRPTALLCVSLLMASMLCSALAQNVVQLFITRLFTGIGVGAVLATVNIVVTEYANDRRRSLCNAIISLGYPVGATLGGLASVELIEHFGWRAPFVFGGLAALLLLPLVWWGFPESLEFLIEKRPRNALGRLNTILPRLRLPVLKQLPQQRLGGAERSGPKDLLAGEYRVPFLASCGLYFCVMMSFYFMISWTPKILTDAGLSLGGGISGAMLLNIGGAIGCLLYGLLATRLGARRLAVVIMLALFATMVLFSNIPYEPLLLTLVAITLGFFLFGAIAVLYVVVPTTFPAALRSTGTGLAMGMGRVGSVIGPALAGVLMDEGWQRPSYFLALAAPLLIAAVLVGLLATNTRRQSCRQPESSIQ